MSTRPGVALGQLDAGGDGVPARPRRPRAERTLGELAQSPATSGSKRNSVERLSSGAFSAKKGFSVVAPMSTTVPSSTPGRRASCWALVKRWISSRNRIVPGPRLPRAPARVLERLTHLLHAGRRPPRAARRPCRGSATRRATVVLPVPGGPKKIAEESRSASTSRRSGAPGPEQVALADDVIEASRAHPLGERRPASVSSLGGRGVEQVGRRRSAGSAARRTLDSGSRWAGRAVDDRGCRARRAGAGASAAGRPS